MASNNLKSNNRGSKLLVKFRKRNALPIIKPLQTKGVVCIEVGVWSKRDNSLNIQKSIKYIHLKKDVCKNTSPAKLQEENY